MADHLRECLVALGHEPDGPVEPWEVLDAIRHHLDSIRPQPAPRPGDGDVMAEMAVHLRGSGRAPLALAVEARRALGLSTYGTTLQRNNGRDHMTDAYQESIDLAAYLWAAGEHDMARTALRLAESVRGRLGREVGDG